MGIQNHTYRRGATYVWRRRLPTRIGGGIIQISLRTNDPLIARRLTMIVGAEAVRVFDLMETTGLSKDEARLVLAKVIETELRLIDERRMSALGKPTPGMLETDIKADHAVGLGFQILAERGASVVHLSPENIREIVGDAPDDDDMKMLTSIICHYTEGFKKSPDMGENIPIKRQLTEILGRDKFSFSEFKHGRQVFFAAKAAALQTSGTGETPMDEAKNLAEQMRSGTWQPPSPVAKPPACEPERPVPYIEREQPADATGYDPAFPALVERFLAQKARQKMSAPMRVQMGKVFALFSEATGVTDIRKLRQGHVAQFVDMLQELPKNYRKSPKDREKTLAQIIKDAPASADRLSDTTINRNLDYLGQLMTKARSEGFANAGMIDVSGLRSRKTIRERDERPAFTPDDVQAIFRHPVWHGFKDKKQWQTKGTQVLKDGLYWVPMIAALSGARREEIAGAKAADITEVEGIPVLHIRTNTNRGLKNLSSERDVPLHPQLIELGLLNHAKEQLRKRGADADLFPDLKTRAARSAFGKALDHRFRLLVARQLDDNPDGKVFHSFRHYVITELGRMPDVTEATRKDIVGHVGDTITAERYSATTPLALKLAAIEKLPRLPVGEQGPMIRINKGWL